MSLYQIFKKYPVNKIQASPLCISILAGMDRGLKGKDEADIYEYQIDSMMVYPFFCRHRKPKYNTQHLNDLGPVLLRIFDVNIHVS